MTGQPLILYVDDERPNRIVFEQSFGKNFRLKVVSSGKEALAVLAEGPVAVLITDQRMPEMSGHELLQHCKRLYPETVRVVITAYSELDPILAAVNEGLVARYVIKPWDRAEVEQLLRWGLEAYGLGQQGSELQLRLVQTERLATMGSIAAAIFHDLGSPLQVLADAVRRLEDAKQAVPALERMLAGGKHSIDDEERRALSTVTRYLPDLAEDLAGVLGYMKMVTTGMKPFSKKAHTEDKQDTEPLAIIQFAQSMCRTAAYAAHGDVRYEGPAALPRVKMAAGDLSQVLVNLTVNAVQALKRREAQGGIVTIHARVDASVVRITVEDNGPGMSQDVLDKLGTPFFTTREEGTGLGFAQCRRLLGRAGASLEIKSSVGVGTAVTMILPVA